MVKGGVFDMVGSRGWFMEEEGVGVDTNSSKLAMYNGDSRNKQVPWLFTRSGLSSSSIRDREEDLIHCEEMESWCLCVWPVVLSAAVAGDALLVHGDTQGKEVMRSRFENSLRLTSSLNLYSVKLEVGIQVSYQKIL
ncbi:hypothetical protein F2Q69_00026973 [Brassica cretica]|uniref:Uncharacterized protein n=1 Tax=Brassica cretica TaxID=69181 RepID=A0A8S9RRR5_BRACR|nr:hypothetical protein F2Q69_00026973 [Brassica cretica]